MGMLLCDQPKEKEVTMTYHFHGEHNGESMIQLVEKEVLTSILIHRILSSQSYGAHADDSHDDEIKVLHVDDPMSCATDPEEWSRSLKFGDRN